MAILALQRHDKIDHSGRAAADYTDGCAYDLARTSCEVLHGKLIDLPHDRLHEYRPRR